MKWRVRGAALSLLLATAPARAQPADARVAAAEDLFQRGKAFMLESRFADACPLLAESYRLDPAGGTLQNLAVCYESNGQWASAFARYEELRTVSKNATPPRADRVAIAEEHLAKVRDRVARIVVVAPADVASSATVEIDGVVYERAAWSSGVAVDPGTHRVNLRASGRRPFEKAIEVPPTGGEQRVVVPPLEKVVVAERAADSGRGVRLAGYVTGGAGLAVLAAGGVFGALTIVENERGKDQCRADGGSGAPASEFAADGRCFETLGAHTRANESKERAETFANVANVLVPLGLVAIGVGTFLVLTHRAPSAARALRLPSRGGILEGTF